MALDKVYWADAPGSTMVFGEHAVLRGHPAIVMAIEPRLKATWSWRQDQTVVIQALGQRYVLPLEGDEDPFQPLNALAYLRVCLEKAWHLGLLTRGFELHIDSQLDAQMGLGSSAALLTAVLTLLSRVLNWPLPEQLFVQALGILHHVQGRGSGADLSASFHGGVQAYWQHPGHYLPLKNPIWPMELIYAGYKTPTGQVLRQLALRESQGMLDLTPIHQMGRISEQAIEAWQQLDLVTLADLAAQHQNCMRTLGLIDSTLATIEQQARIPGQAIKVAGSGLGDCLLAWGALNPAALSYRRFPVLVATEGVRYGSA